MRAAIFRPKKSAVAVGSAFGRAPIQPILSVLLEPGEQYARREAMDQIVNGVGGSYTVSVATEEQVIAGAQRAEDAAEQA